MAVHPKYRTADPSANPKEAVVDEGEGVSYFRPVFRAEAPLVGPTDYKGRNRAPIPDVGGARVGNRRGENLAPGQAARGDETARALHGAMPPVSGAGIVSGLMRNVGADRITDGEARRYAADAPAPHGGNANRNKAAGRVDVGFEPPVRLPGQNLPSVVNHPGRNLAVPGGDAGASIRWHAVRRLPGYQVNQIRALGRGVFDPFASSDLELMEVITTVMGQGREVDAIKRWLQKVDAAGRPVNAVQSDEATLHFPGGEVPRGNGRNMGLDNYRPDIKVWRSKEFSFVVVKETSGGMAAEYIYKVPDDRPFAGLLAGSSAAEVGSKKIPHTPVKQAGSQTALPGQGCSDAEDRLGRPNISRFR